MGTTDEERSMGTIDVEKYRRVFVGTVAKENPDPGSDLNSNAAEAGCINNDPTEAGCINNDSTEAGCINNDVTEAGYINNESAEGSHIGYGEEIQANAGFAQIEEEYLIPDPMPGTRRGHYRPTNDVWMDMSWATMSPDRMRQTPIWTPAVSAASEEWRSGTDDYSYIEEIPDEGTGWDRPAEGRRSSRYTGGRQGGRAGRPTATLIVLALVGLLAAAAIFGQMKSESRAEALIEEYMDS